MIEIQAAWSDIEAMVTGPVGAQMLYVLYRLRYQFPLQPSEKPIAEELIPLGLCRREQGDIHLTEFGAKCADSAREYVFWVDRGRKLHGEGTTPLLSLETFRDKNVVEIGSGWGCNLVRLATVAKRAVGVEVEPVYIEFSRILAKREGVKPPEIFLAAGESTGLGSGEFDWVLLWSVLQYMDIQEALRESMRLLRPGGFLLLAQLLLSDFVVTRLKRVAQERDPRRILSVLSVLANTLWYQAFGKRLRTDVKEDATARPIHPTKSYLIATAQRIGLRFRDDLSCRERDHLCMVLQKPD